MKMNKQSSIIFGAQVKLVLLLFTVLSLSVPAFALESNNTVSIGTVTTPPGTVISVPIMVEHATGIASIGVKLTYEPGVVNVTGVAQGDFPSFWGFDNTNAANGWVTINTFILGQNLTGDVKVADVTLEAVGDTGDSSFLRFVILSLADQYGNDMPGTTDEGTFIISLSSEEGGGAGSETSTSTPPATLTPTPRPTSTGVPTPLIPGFKALLGTFGILAAGYLIAMRRKRKSQEGIR